MDPATRIQLEGALYVVALPAAAVVGTLVLGRRLRPAAARRPVLGGLALLLGMTTAFVGVTGPPSFPPKEAYHWVLLGLWAAGAGGLALDGLRPAARTWAVGGLALSVLGVFGWQVLKPLAGVWGDDGPLDEIATSAWVADAVAFVFVAWLALDVAAREVPAPVSLGPLALGFAAAAGVIGLSGSALIGQLMGALGVAVGLTGLAGWRWPDVRAGHGAVAAGMTGFGLLLVYGHFYVDAPRPALGLLLLLPFVPLAARGRRPTWRAALIALLLSVVPVVAALSLAKSADEAEQAGSGESIGEGHDYGAMY